MQNLAKMKKLFFVLLAFLVVSGSRVEAQSKVSKMKVDKTKTVKEDAQATPMAQSEPSKLKKDGSPDMRYKENKAAKEAVPAGPLKKDGTPDKRYKANKDAAQKK